MINTKDAEPWSFGEEVEQISRNFIRFRYQLMPYIYSLFYEASRSGKPIQRSLAVDYPFEPRVFAGTYQNQYMFGPSILVAPVESSKDICKVFLPEGNWYSLYDGKKFEGDQECFIECPVHKLPVFVKEGAILPMKKCGEHTKDQLETLIIHLYNGTITSSFSLYEDDGETFGYQKDVSSIRKITFDPINRKVSMSAVDGSFHAGWKTIRFAFHSFGSKSELKVNGKNVATKVADHSFFDPLAKYDPIADPDSMGSETITTIEFAFTQQQITIEL
jgi:alpha-glucosidase